jgi:hypothetical protein
MHNLAYRVDFVVLFGVCCGGVGQLVPSAAGLGGNGCRLDVVVYLRLTIDWQNAGSL